MKGIAATVGAGGRRDFFWLDGNFAMTASSPVRGLGFNLTLGGIFTSVPAAVASMVRAADVLDPGVSAEMAREQPEPRGGGAAPRAGREAPATETGGAERSEAAARTGAMRVPDLRGHLDDAIPRVQLVDLFGLGLDYAMYTKGLRGDYDTNDPGPWYRLGGEFTSAPAAIAWAGRVDVFGVGLDHAMYTKTRRGRIWTPEWQSLGGTFTSAASLVLRGPDQLELFARGADFTLRRNQTDGSSWFGWQNLGGDLASAPVAVSWGPDRLDVFALFKDGTLRHRWWDGQIWNDWESLGGNYTGEPAVAAWEPGRMDVFVVGAEDRKLRHYWFSGNTWSLPEVLDDEPVTESVTVISTAPNRLEIFAPGANGQLRRRTWDGQAWQRGAAGAGIRLPSQYRLSVDHVRVETTRALDTDTDGAMASVAVGNRALQTRTQWIGGIGGLTTPKEAQTNLLDFEPVSVDLAEAFSFGYLVVNNGHAERDKILAALANAGDSLSLASVSSTKEDIAKGIINFAFVKIAEAITVPVIGPITDKIEEWVLEKLSDAIFESCDGVVATELRAMMGRDLFNMTDHGKKTIRVTTEHPGTDSPTFCGRNSEYKVTWSIKPL